MSYVNAPPPVVESGKKKLSTPVKAGIALAAVVALVGGGVAAGALIAGKERGDDAPSASSSSYTPSRSAPSRADRADAMEVVFLKAMHEEGIRYPSERWVVGKAHELCSLWKRGERFESAALTFLSDFDFSYEDTGYFMGAATYAMCPEYDYKFDR